MAMVNLGADATDLQTKNDAGQNEDIGMGGVQNGSKFGSKSHLTRMIKVESRSTLEKILLVAVVVLVILCIVFLALWAKDRTDSDNSYSRTEKVIGTDDFSEEAQRIGLKKFLEKVQNAYYEYNKHASPWKPKKTDEDFEQSLHENHASYNTTPAYLKIKTDAAFALLDEIKTIEMDENKLYPRELKAVEQVKHFLQTVFGNPFDENYYNGDWMLGPNHFCWQTMCSIGYGINAYGYYVNPKNLKDLRTVLDKIMQNRQTIQQYKSNMQQGVRAGWVRSRFTCQSGLDAFKQEFQKISKDNDPNDILDEWFVKFYVRESFLNLTTEDRATWKKEKGKSPEMSIKDTLIEGIGKPMVELIEYMTNDHIRHCLPMNLASGISNLPVEYIYWDNARTNKKTTRLVPGSNQRLDGKMSYRNIIPYFTTSDITPEEVYKIGKERLAVLYPQVVEIAKNMTQIENETEAVAKFRKMLKRQEMYYNNESFPEIESNGTAHKNCTSPEKAKIYCPRRWAALQIWIESCRKAMSMLSPKLIPHFYHVGEKITVPNCPIDMQPSFNPSSGAQFFNRAGATCTKSAKYGLPFFLENFGPRFSEWSVTAHEAWPGHHTQIQARLEYFQDPYGGVPKWIDDQTYYTFFTEGWGLYAENPVIAQDTDTYKENPLQKFGMLKWQIWRALRLIVDTGIHYRGMNRSEALGYFSKYAWDDTDLAKKEITRYQSVPGQALSYMLGQQKLVQLRKYALEKLGKKFSVQDFHYQTLSQGSAPEAYLVKHIGKYVQCTLGKLDGTQCDIILKPRKAKEGSGSSVTKEEDEGPPKPSRRHYV